MWTWYFIMINNFYDLRQWFDWGSQTDKSHPWNFQNNLKVPKAFLLLGETTIWNNSVSQKISAGCGHDFTDGCDQAHNWQGTRKNKAIGMWRQQDGANTAAMMLGTNALCCDEFQLNWFVTCMGSERLWRTSGLHQLKRLNGSNTE